VKRAWWPFYIISVNHALYRLGIEPHRVPPQIRQDAQAAGMQNDCTPQEMATIIAYFLLGPALTEAANVAVGEWLRKGKVREYLLRRCLRAGMPPGGST
jgi:hypothetical protein